MAESRRGDRTRPIPGPDSNPSCTLGRPQAPSYLRLTRVFGKDTHGVAKFKTKVTQEK